MNKLIISLLLSLSFAAYGQLVNADEAQKQVPQSCINGCLVLSGEELAAFQKKVQEYIQSSGYQAYVQGLEKGYKDGVEDAKGNPKICPKNI